MMEIYETQITNQIIQKKKMHNLRFAPEQRRVENKIRLLWSVVGVAKCK